MPQEAEHLGWGEIEAALKTATKLAQLVVILRADLQDHGRTIADTRDRLYALEKAVEWQKKKL